MTAYLIALALAGLVAMQRHVPEVEERMVEVPAVDRVRVLVPADVGQVAAEGLELAVVELAEPGRERGLERHVRSTA